jgi:hypothetical protein
MAIVLALHLRRLALERGTPSRDALTDGERDGRRGSRLAFAGANWSDDCGVTPWFF